jgi:AmiR/NasT family two-component response regulator
LAFFGVASEAGPTSATEPKVSLLMTTNLPSGERERPSLAMRKRAQLERLPAKPERILVAEDEHLVAMQMCAQLGELGYRILGPAVDGESALRLARTSPPDLAILDIRMPGKDGLSVATELLAELAVPSVIVSAHATGDYAAAASSAGVFGYLVKPVMVDQLRVTLDVAWKRYSDFAMSAFEAADLRRRLDERRLIEQAKWLLVDRKKIGEPEAMRLLQERARSSRQPLATIAKHVIDSGQLP